MKNVLRFDFTWKDLTKKCKCVSKTSPMAAANSCETWEGVRFVWQTLAMKNKAKTKPKTKKNNNNDNDKKNYFGPAVIVTKCIFCLQARSEGNSF